MAKTVMKGEIQFLLYNLPEDSGKVQVVIKEDTIGVLRRLWHSCLESVFQLSANI